jgi:hypothetical protein
MVCAGNKPYVDTTVGAARLEARATTERLVYETTTIS